LAIERCVLVSFGREAEDETASAGGDALSGGGAARETFSPSALRYQQFRLVARSTR
jgi:hypothetical protein